MTCSLQHSPSGDRVGGSNCYSLYYHLTPNVWGLCRLSDQNLLLVYTDQQCVRNSCQEKENLTCWHFPFLHSFPEFSLDTLSSFTVLLLTSWLERRLQGKRCMSLSATASHPLCSSLVCESQGKFGSVISGWSEPFFVGIILHRRPGMKP